ncbi:murein biosynthesis integral membrane protein MurJ [Nocardiopsis lambiniae]|uniref:Murein biosynthesis integral membrane protein MurJ n=1 Tax=Nocardiopsis lambiniae TaxID=3075539 RepID=A0ABU2MAN8_9ACTN|nr:murein biosynthesis integral membrane protein MurJ [Nocardiopsis sp. DSM 44743]MDT0329730.1 murein biosynthesis integral membrane protein MurJ [Nocardiopsis sp. DSM 44743]
MVMPEDVLDVYERDEPATEPETGLTTRRDPSDIGDLGTADRAGMEDGDEIGGSTHTAPGNLAKSSAIMALGTVFSRATGFVRTIVLAAAIGTQMLGDAYQVAGMVPYMVYDLLIGGLLASVFVPFLVKRRRLDVDGGNKTEQRLVTLMLVSLLLITGVSVLLSEWFIRIYAGEFTGAQFEVSVIMARYLVTQIFFIGASGLASAMLNARGRFGAPMWAPVLNNVVIIGIGVWFLHIAGPGRTPDTVTSGELMLLGLGTAAGQVVQALVLLWALGAAGFRWRPRLDLRGAGLGEAAQAASWMMLYIVVAQLGALVSTNVASRAGTRAAELGFESGSGIAAYKFASMLFQLPYAIIAVSVITALLPRMSEHVAAGRKDQVRSDFSRGFRLSSVLIVPISVAMIVFAIPFCVMIYAQGSTSAADAAAIGRILMVFCVMLIPFTLFQLQMRVFYALGDTRTPALVAIPSEIAHATTAIALLFVVEPQHVVVLLPIPYGLYYIVGAIIMWYMLHKRLNGLDGRHTAVTLFKLHLATVPSAVFGIAMIHVFQGLSGDFWPGLASMVIGGVVGGVLFVVSAKFLNVTEVTSFLELLKTRLRRR